MSLRDQGGGGNGMGLGEGLGEGVLDVNNET